MGRLDLSLLGTPGVRHAGQPLVFPTRKVLALLIYLVVEGGRPSREKLTTLFWPESEEGPARASFRRALALLRQALGETAALPHLIVEGEALGFDFTSDCACDLHSLQMAAQATHSAEQVSPGLIERLRSAATLYRGNFLDGFSLPDAPDFDDWVRFQRERWHHQMEELFDQLTQLQEEAGAIAGALETASRWRRYSPFNEQVYLRLMHLHFVAGDRSAALHVYADCRSMLATEFHAVPTPETEALAHPDRAARRHLFWKAPSLGEMPSTRP